MQKTGDEIAILKALINAKYYFESLPFYSSDKTGFVDKETGYVFNSTYDLLDTLHEIGIQGDSLNEVGAVLEEWYELYKQQQETITEAPRSVGQDATTLTSDQLENLEEYARSRNEQNADIRSREKQRIDDFINEYEEKIAKAKSLQNKLINKNIYAKVFIPKEEDLTQDEQNKLDILKDYANDEKKVGNNGLTRKQILINDLTAKIEEILEPEIKNLTQEEKIFIAQTYAVKLVNEIAKPVDNTFNIQTAVLINISKEIDSGSNTFQKSIPEDSLIRQAREGSIFLEIESRKNQFTTREIAERIFTTKITSAILGTDPEHILINFIEDNTLEAPTHIINLGSLNTEYTRILDEQTKLIRGIKENGINNTSSFITSDTRQFLGTIISKSNVGKLALKDPVLNSVFSQYVLRKKVIFQAVYQSEFVKLAVDLIPNAGPVLALTGKALGITIVKPVVKEVAKDVAIKAVSETTKAAVIKLGADSIITKILATAGSVGGWIGTAIGYAIGTILVKLADKLKDWWTRNKDNLGPVASIIATIGGLIFFGPVGGVVSGGLALAATGTLGVFATGTAAVLGFIGSSIGVTVVTSVIITALIIPPLIAFIMLVINNSAYIVPPDARSLGLNLDNPYVLVTKVANPDKFENPTSNKVTVTYTVTIKALKSPLTKISITDATCKVSKKNASTTQDCPPELENIPPLPADLTISPSSSYSFTFTSEFDSKYADSSIFDTIKIKATAEEKEIETSGSESVCIGDCPHGCFEISDDNETWPDFKSKLEGATQTLTSKFPSFVDQACVGREKVKLCYTTSNPTPNGTNGLCNGAIYAITSQVSDGDDRCIVNFNQCVFESGRTDNDVFFLLTHELSHHIQWRDGGNMINKYENAGGPSELPLCSYSNTRDNPDEGSAEANALYANEGVASFSTCSMNFQSQYPNNYGFAQSYMNNP